MAKKNDTMGKRNNAMEGGKAKRGKTAKRDKTVKRGKTAKRKLSNGAKSWQKSVMEVYKELKAKDANTKLKDAMIEAAKRKKKGQL